MKQKYLLTLFFIFIAGYVKSQKNPDYYITKAKDTVRCEILAVRLAKIHSFFSSAAPNRLIVKVDGKRKTVIIDELNGFFINERSEKAVPGEYITFGTDLAFKKKISGVLSLYLPYDVVNSNKKDVGEGDYNGGEYNGGNSTEEPPAGVDNYVITKNNKWVKLIGFLYLKKQIATLISDCPSLYKDFTEAGKYKFDDPNDIEKIVITYNECMQKK